MLAKAMLHARWDGGNSDSTAANLVCIIEDGIQAEIDIILQARLSEIKEGGDEEEEEEDEE